MIRSRLSQHSATAARPWCLDASVAAGVGALQLTFELSGDLAGLCWPPPSRGRQDGLWRHTCFELFARPTTGEAYCEFNFSPSGAWAAYAFDGPRRGMRPLELVEAPAMSSTTSAEGFSLSVGLALPQMRGPFEVGLAAVIEETDQTLSWWALEHPAGTPDFHDPRGFTLALEL